jgi:plasmid maintenance system antidote protein VapI
MNDKKNHIGEIVQKVFNQKDRTKTDFAKAIGVSNQNINRMFDSSDWSVLKLIKAGEFLEHDFGYLFSLDKESKPPKIVLQIEITSDKVNDVLELIDDNELCKVLKK